MDGWDGLWMDDIMNGVFIGVRQSSGENLGFVKQKIGNLIAF